MDTSETGLEKIIVGWLVKEEERAIVLENENTNVKPIPVGTGGGKSQPEMDALSSIVKDFNDTYGNIEWKIVTKCSVRSKNCRHVSPQVLTLRMRFAMATSR